MTDDKKQRTKTMINIFQAFRKRNKEVVRKEPKIASSTNSLCVNCSDYYDIPPCKIDSNGDRNCFPSLTMELVSSR